MYIFNLIWFHTTYPLFIPDKQSLLNYYFRLASESSMSEGDMESVYSNQDITTGRALEGISPTEHISMWLLYRIGT